MNEGNGTGRIRIDSIALSDNWLYFAAGDPTPAAHELPLWLSRAITDWLKNHPERSVTATLPIMSNGNTVAVHLWHDQGIDVE